MNSESGSLYDEIGGEQVVQKLVEAFYSRVVKDANLAPLFQTDIQEVMRKQFMFLTQFLGGETLYSNEFGHPQMRFRHLPFEITPIRAKAWLKCMKEAMDEIGMEGNARDYFYMRLTQVAGIMVNTNEEDNV